ncbi:MAG TPA: glycosyltransferase [Candidatus Binatia bacterium]|jgi:biofilm PGA synthesis N-glycosyltransferase PgaC|nr:glycosyltransferase [Candidatus Binatia bacterium]
MAKAAKAASYTVVTPVRDEEEHIQRTVDSIVAQTVRPTRWVIVNDGSKDRTGPVADEAARAHPWIRAVHRPDRGFRKAGGGVIDAFYDGYSLIENEAADYVVKLDGDLCFDRDYFERCFHEFDRDQRLGIGGGTVCKSGGASLEVESKISPRFHVRGATKIYRRACWEQIGGLMRAPGWDTLDEVKANMLGWSTRTFSDIKLVQLRLTGAAYGAWNDRVKGGLGNYIAGYHPLFMFLRCVRRMAERPYFLGGCGLMFGYLKGYALGVPQVEDKNLIRYFRQQQINRLLGRSSLWD